MNIKSIFLIIFSLSFISNLSAINWRKDFGVGDACLLVNFTAVVSALIYNELVYRKLNKKMSSALYMDAVKINEEYQKKSNQIAAFVLLNGLMAISIISYRHTLRHASDFARASTDTQGER